MAEVVPAAQQQFSPGEFFARIAYERQGRLHVHQVPISGASPVAVPPGLPTDFTAWNFATEGNAVNVSVNAAVAINAYVDALSPQFFSDTTFIDALLYRQETPGDAPRPVASYAFTAKVGTGDTPPVSGFLMKTTISYRTATFGRFKVVLIETVQDRPARARGATAVAAGGALNTYILSSAGSWIVGRDGSRPTSLISFSVTEDNGLRAKFL